MEVVAEKRVRGPSRREVYETLRRQVVTLELPPGTPLSENELAAAMGVSRTPVRESLILLSREGLVQVFPKVGSFVSRVDLRKVADAQFLREAVELSSLEDISYEPDPDIVAELNANLVLQRAAAHDIEGFFGLDEAFHHGLLRLGGHGEAWSTVVSAKAHLDRARRLGLHEGSSLASFTKQHAEMLGAVVAGETAQAHLLMRKHLRMVFEDIERIWLHSPELFASDSDAIPFRRSVAFWQ